jgi:hypothetical protein
MLVTELKKLLSRVGVAKIVYEHQLFRFSADANSEISNWRIYVQIFSLFPG